jgi:hypothetical protein
MEKCDGCGENTLFFTTYCVTCDQWYCAACSTAHTRQNATKTDILLGLIPEESDLPRTKIGINCKICDSKKEVISLCVTCRELYCDECSNRHHRMHATKDHHLTVIRLRDGSQISKPIKSTVPDNKYAQVEVSKFYIYITYWIKVWRSQRIIRSNNSKNDRHCNGQKKKERTSNDTQNATQKTQNLAK